MLDEGVSRNMLDAAKPAVAQAIAATSRARRPPTAPPCRGCAPRRRPRRPAAPARAAGRRLFRLRPICRGRRALPAALQKGGEDANLVNSRLGAALALAGRRPEAEAALRAVTGPRADLAGFWLAWLARRPGLTCSNATGDDFDEDVRRPRWPPTALIGAAPALAQYGPRPSRRSTPEPQPPAQRRPQPAPAGRARSASYNLSRAERTALPAGRSSPSTPPTGRPRRRRCPRRRRRRAAPTPNIWSARSGSRSASAPTTRSSSRRRSTR